MLNRVRLCDPMDCSPPGSSVHEVLQARILEWIAMPSSKDLPNPGIEPRSPTLQADSLPSEPQGKPCNIVLPIFINGKTWNTQSAHPNTMQSSTALILCGMWALGLGFTLADATRKGSNWKHIPSQPKCLLSSISSYIHYHV